MNDTIPVHVTYAARERIAYAAHQAGTSNLKRLEQLIQDAAMALPPVPPLPRERRQEPQTATFQRRVQERTEAGETTTQIAVIYQVPPDRVRRAKEQL